MLSYVLNFMTEFLVSTSTICVWKQQLECFENWIQNSTSSAVLKHIFEYI